MTRRRSLINPEIEVFDDEREKEYVSEFLDTRIQS